MGVGKIRHLELRELWIQEQVAQKRLQLEKIPSSSNEADILTKQLKGQQLFEMLCESLGEKQDDNIENEVEYKVRDKVTDEDETQCCVRETVKDELWRKG